MRLLDFVLLAGMAWYAFKGFRKGFSGELFSLLALLVGGWCAIPASPLVQRFIVPYTETRYLISLVVSFVACIAAVFLLGRLFKFGLNFIVPPVVDKIAGGLFGAFKVMFCAGILFYCINSADKNGKILKSEKKQESLMYTPCAKTAEFLLPKLADFKSKLEENEQWKKLGEQNKELIKRH